MKGEQLTATENIYKESYEWWYEHSKRQLQFYHKTMRLMFKIIKKQQRENNELREKLMKAQG